MKSAFRGEFVRKQKGATVAIIKCSECGENVSDKAPSCPGCGVLIQNKRRLTAVGYLGSGLGLLFIFGSFQQSNGEGAILFLLIGAGLIFASNMGARKKQ